MGAGDAIGLTFGGLDDQEDAAVVGESLIQLEGKGVTLAHDGGGGRVLNSHESRGRGHRGTATGDNPVVETGEQVGTGNLGSGTEDATALLAEGKLVPET